MKNGKIGEKIFLENKKWKNMFFGKMKNGKNEKIMFLEKMEKMVNHGYPWLTMVNHG